MTNNFSHKIRSQFPAIYLEEGDELVEFMEAYYEFIEEKHSLNRDMLNLNDIDRTVDDFVVYFKEKYLKDFPFLSATDNRFLVKHVVDFYRTKGSDKSLKLLIRLLFNEEAEIYHPSTDILKLSDSHWHVPKYVEVTSSNRAKSFLGKRIYGSRTKASALVESIITKRVNGKIIDVIYISDVKDDFERGELVSDDGVLLDAPRVTGSLSSIEIDNGGLAYEVGNVLDVIGGDGQHGQVRVSETYPATNRVDFRLVDGGWGSTTTNATSVTVTPQGTGAGATFEIGGLEYTETANVIVDQIYPYSNTELGGTFGFPVLPSANLATPLSDALDYRNLTLGQITHLSAINPGDGYNADVDVKIDTPSISTFRIKDQVVEYNILEGSFKVGELVTQDSPPARGIVKEVTVNSVVVKTASFSHRFEAGAIISGSDSFGRAEVTAAYDYLENPLVMGNNAIVSGVVRNANGLVRAVEVIDSGFGYKDGERVQMRSTTANNQFLVEGAITVLNTGKGRGAWQTTTSHLNSEKKIRDNYYYQEFSYEVAAKMSLDKYRQAVLDLVHVSGTKLFGRFEGVSNIEMEPQGHISQEAGTSILNRFNTSATSIIFDFENGELYNNGEVSLAETLSNE